MLDTVHFEQLHKTMAETAAIHHDGLIGSIERIHNGRLHTRGARAGQKDRARTFGGAGELEEKTLVFEHDLGKLRRTEIRDLIGAQGADALVRLNRADGEIEHGNAPFCSDCYRFSDVARDAEASASPCAFSGTMISELCQLRSPSGGGVM